MSQAIRKYLAEIGRKGGAKSRRTLDPEQARAMVRVREARRAYRKYHAQCFWSCAPDYPIGPADVAWVAEQLMKYGGHQAWPLPAAGVSAATWIISTTASNGWHRPSPRITGS